jgi:hypothetical protein
MVTVRVTVVVKGEVYYIDDNDYDSVFKRFAKMISENLDEMKRDREDLKSFMAGIDFTQDGTENPRVKRVKRVDAENTTLKRVKRA